ncbi:MAG: UvrB/UvrC motif-containing protein, partial [Lentisphaeria bacterium]|nr:UvrB/UvrC motif-containing protein [Lentisphaeria bacterium]
RLQNALESAVKQEEYEKAALLRDRIHALLPEMDGGLFGNNSGNTTVSGKRSGEKKEKKAPPEKNL